jgi:hypothetical protein
MVRNLTRLGSGRVLTEVAEPFHYSSRPNDMIRAVEIFVMTRVIPGVVLHGTVAIPWVALKPEGVPVPLIAK